MKTTSFGGVQYTDAEMALVEKVSDAIRNATPLIRLKFLKGNATFNEYELEAMAVAALKASGGLVEEAKICPTCGCPDHYPNRCPRCGGY